MEDHLTNIKLTKDQQKVLDSIKNFLGSDVPIFILKGYAGTGKTTMVRQIANYIVNNYNGTLKLMAPTGRAARVLAKKTGMDAATIHKNIYDTDHYEIKEVTDLADSEFKVVFGIRHPDDSVIAIVDEASMVSSKETKHELFQFGTGVLLNDLLTYVRPSFGGKVIFVGDPAQLPPVGDNHSYALDESFFAKEGLKCKSETLTEVLRQGGNSTILKDAMQVRNLLKSNKRNRLAFEEKTGEVESLQPSEVVDNYMSTKSDAASGDCVIIAYSNRKVADYNKEIRFRKFGKDLPLQPNDSLMVVRNNYDLQLMNGDFTRVISLGKIDKLSAPVFVQRGGHKERIIDTLDFQDATVLNDRNELVNCKLVLNLLDNDQPSLSVDEQRALYINFRMRYPKLRPGTQPFTDTIKKDPYYNALQVKYGYAVTGHKCQGGEWKVALVDYDGRTGLNDDCLRWNYTATTRAQHTLYVTNLPHITPFDKFRIDDITTVKKISPEFREFGKIEDSSFYSSNVPDFLRAKCECIMKNMEYSPYRIKSITSKPYREIYEIETPDGIERYDLIYKGSGAFLPAKTQFPTNHTVLIENMLNNEGLMPVYFKYVPSDDVHRQLYSYIKSACDSLDITITNVVEHNDSYYTMFYFSTSGTVSYLQVYIDGRGYITNARPASFIGKEDHELQNLIDVLRI